MSTRAISRIVACMLLASLLWSISFAQDHADPGASEFAGAERCLVCHNNMGDQHSVHLAELEKTGVEGHRGMPLGGAAPFHCEACHGPAAQHAERQQGGPWVLPPVSFADSDANPACLECHARQFPDLGKRPGNSTPPLSVTAWVACAATVVLPMVCQRG